MRRRRRPESARPPAAAAARKGDRHVIDVWGDVRRRDVTSRGRHSWSRAVPGERREEMGVDTGLLPRRPGSVDRDRPDHGASSGGGGATAMLTMMMTVVVAMLEVDWFAQL